MPPTNNYKSTNDDSSCTVMTRSPSPYDDDDDNADHSDDHIKVVMKELNNNKDIPATVTSDSKPSSRMEKLKSFTRAASGRKLGGDLVFESSDSSSDDNDHDDAKSSASSSDDKSAILPKKRFSRRLKSGSNLLSSFSRKKNPPGGGRINHYDNHSSHPCSMGGQLTNLLEEDGEQQVLRPNSEHDRNLHDVIQANSGGASTSAAGLARMLRDDYDGGDGDNELIEEENDELDNSRPRLRERRPPHTRQLSNRSISSFASSVSDHHEQDNELDDMVGQVFPDSRALMESLEDGHAPSSDELQNFAAVRANEYIEECLSADVSVLDRKAWDRIKQYAKTDLIVGAHLGKGSFSDAFEVHANVEEEVATIKSFRTDGDDLDSLIEAKFGNRPGGMGAIKDVAYGDGDDDNDDDKNLDDEINAKFGSSPIQEDGEDVNAEIDAMFAKGLEESSRDDKDAEIDAMFGAGPSLNEKAIQPRQQNHPPSARTSLNGSGQFATGRRRQTVGGRNKFSGSVCLGTHTRGLTSRAKPTKKVIMAMKCLRPQIRANVEQFMIGVEDLVHETAMLASLDHPNIIKLHGRAGGCVSNSFRLSDGYFILLDRLKDTLDDRIQSWKKTSDKRAPPAMSQIKTATSIAGALSYLHTKNIVFRDLKPANVGFDSAGILKLFDFGFAIGVDEPPRPGSVCSDHSVGTSEQGEDREEHLLYDKCGTPRYMAPEVGLGRGYGIPVDVYSFGILLWEICALKKPFGAVKSSEEFHKLVFEKGTRPKLSKHWPASLSKIITDCWTEFPEDRPKMDHVKTMLSAHARELSVKKEGGKDNLMRMSFRRFTG